MNARVRRPFGIEFGACVLAAALVAVLSIAEARAAERVALVVGNGAYQRISPLANPANDAELMAATLRGLGFDVSVATDATQQEFKSVIRDFGRRLRTAGSDAVGLFFYAGHGVQSGEHNYLVPLDAPIEEEADLEFEAVPARWVLSRMEMAGNALNMVILDACRNNPFKSGFRSGLRGLTRMPAPTGSLIAYSAGPGQAAKDGDGRNSPYTLALAEALEVPGLKVEEVFKRVRNTVLKRVGAGQTPWEESSLMGDFYFRDGASVASATVPDRQSGPSLDERAKEAFEGAKYVHTISAYRLVVEQFPGHFYAALAQAQIDKMTGGGSGPADPATAETVASAPDAGDQLAEGPAGSAPEDVEASLGLDREARRMIQQGLASLGFAPGPADGWFGARTRDAIRRYQEEKELRATGYLTEDTAQALRALGEEAATAQAKAEAELREAQRRAEAERRRDEEAARLAEEARRRQAEAERRKQERALREPGRRFRDCEEAWCPELVVVPAGSFMMGSPAGEAGRNDDHEGPVHGVRIAEAFAVGVYEVTRREFSHFVRETRHSTGDWCIVSHEDRKTPDGLGWRNPGFGQTDGHPVSCVSWEDAHAYVRWLSARTGKTYRLLSESEWEYVARAGTRTSRHWGDRSSNACQYANIADRSAKKMDTTGPIHACRDGYMYTAPVGSFSANPYGLHDVMGNVWEWVEDCWHGSYTGAPGDGRAWTSGGDCNKRVIRGASLDFGTSAARSAFRAAIGTGDRINVVGFRVARTLN